MTELCHRVLDAMLDRTLVTAESCTGGGIGAALTAVPGSSKTYKGGIICYTDWVKRTVLGVELDLLAQNGAVSMPVAEAMAIGARQLLKSDIAVSVTGLAGPEGDCFGHEVGTVFIGFSSQSQTVAAEFHFAGDREAVRKQAIEAALEIILKYV